MGRAGTNSEESKGLNYDLHVVAGRQQHKREVWIDISKKKHFKKDKMNVELNY